MLSLIAFPEEVCEALGRAGEPPAARYDVHVIEFTMPSLPMMGIVSRILIVSDAPPVPCLDPCWRVFDYFLRDPREPATASICLIRRSSSASLASGNIWCCR